MKCFFLSLLLFPGANKNKVFGGDGAVGLSLYLFVHKMVIFASELKATLIGAIDGNRAAKHSSIEMNTHLQKLE